MLESRESNGQLDEVANGVSVYSMFSPCSLTETKVNSVRWSILSSLRETILLSCCVLSHEVRSSVDVELIFRLDGAYRMSTSDHSSLQGHTYQACGQSWVSVPPSQMQKNDRARDGHRYHHLHSPTSTSALVSIRITSDRSWPTCKKPFTSRGARLIALPTQSLARRWNSFNVCLLKVKSSDS